MRCGAPSSVLGENTMTKLMASDSQSILRKEAMVASTLRPRMFTVIGSPSFKPEPLGELGVEGDERRTGVVLRPPFARDDLGIARHRIGVGEAAIAGEHPAGIRSGFDLLDRNAFQRHDAAAQHRRVIELGGRLYGQHRVLEGVEIGGLDVEEVIGRRIDLDIAFDLGEQRAMDQRHRDEQSQPETERDGDRAGERSRSADAGEREPERRRLGAAEPGGVALHQQAEAGEEEKGDHDADGDRGGDGALLGCGDGEREQAPGRPPPSQAHKATPSARARR